MLKILNAKIIFFCIILAGIILRLYNIGYDDLWYDEIISFWVSSPQHTFIESYSIHSQIEINTYTYHFLLKVIYNLFGYDLNYARYLSAFFSILSILLIPYLTKELKYKNLTNLTTFLVAFNIFLISYSQEGRVYSILFFFSLASYLYFIKIFYKRTKIYTYFLFFISTLVAIILHPFAMIIFFSYSLFLFSRFTILKEVRPDINYSLITIFIFSILFYFSFFLNMNFANSEHYWISNPDLKFYTNFYFSNFFGSRIMGIIFLFSFFLLLFKNIKIIKNLNIITIFILIIFLSYFLPIIFGYLFKPILISRYIIFILGPILLVISILSFEIKNQKLKYSLIGILIFSTFANHFSEQTFKQFWQNRIPSKPEYEKAIGYMIESDHLNYIIKVKKMKSNKDSLDAIANYISILNEKNASPSLVKKVDLERKIEAIFWQLCPQDINERECRTKDILNKHNILEEKNFNNINLKLIKIVK